MKTFNELGICPEMLRVIEELGFSEPTEIQERSIPIILSGEDIIAGSATGSGKTLAFASSIIKTVERGKGVQAIVLTPTRELAVQVTKSIEEFSKYKKIRITSVYGGVSINPQIDRIKTSDVIVGTPGRVLDHLSRRTLSLNQIKIAVLDEADRMLDMGFIDDVNNILRECPKERQTLLYSATMSSDIYGIAKNNMKDPKKISVDSYVDPSKLTQVYYQVPQNLKFSLLVHFLKEESAGLSMVFCNTQRITDYVVKNLIKQGIDAIAIHGGLTQAKRNRTLDTFHSGRTSVLVCTDVAARGLHIEDVKRVYNYDIPNDAKQYVHRIGRTARAGNEGLAINLLTQRDYENFDNVLRDNHDLKIEKGETPQVEMIEIESIKKRRSFNGNRNGGNRRSFNYRR